MTLPYTNAEELGESSCTVFPIARLKSDDRKRDAMVDKALADPDGTHFLVCLGKNFFGF